MTARIAATSPPETRLLLLAAQLEHNQSCRSDARYLLRDPLDWTRLIKSAITQRLVSPLADLLETMDESLVPGDIAYALDYRVDVNTATSEQWLEGVRELSRAFERQGLDYFWWQGPCMTLSAYEDLVDRDPASPAVWVHPRQMEEVRQVLAELGWRPQRKSAQAHHPGFAQTGEVHDYGHPDREVRARIDSTLESAGMRLDAVEIAQRSRAMADDDASLRVPCPEDQVLLVCVEAGLSNWSALVAARDVAAMFRKHPRLDTDVLTKRAGQMRCKRLLELGLALAAGLTNEDRLQETHSPAVRRWVVRIRDHVSEDAPLKQTWIAKDRLQWDMRDGVGARLRWLLGRRRDSSVGNVPAAATANPAVNEDAEGQARVAKARNETHWGDRSESWERWASGADTGAHPFNQALMQAVNLQAGQSVLDLACGVGETSLAVAPVVGAQGWVVATDLAYPMIRRTQTRAQDAGADNIVCCAADMERLPFQGRGFDAVVCRLGIMYAPHPEQALRETKRILKPGGRAAFLVCGARDDNPILRIVHQEVSRLFELGQEDNAIEPFRYGEANRLAALMGEAGFSDVHEQMLSLTHTVPQGIRFWQGSLERGLGIAAEMLPPMTLQELDRRILAAFTPYLKGDRYELPSVSRVAVGSI